MMLEQAEALAYLELLHNAVLDKEVGLPELTVFERKQQR